MQLIIASVFAGLLALASAQTTPNLAGLPSCARACVGTSVNVPGCQGLDIRCICSNRDFLNNISCCIQRSCSAEEQASTIRFASGLCATAGVNVPTEATCPSGSASASPSPTTTGASASASSAVSSASSVLSSRVSSASSAVASATSEAGSRASSLLSAASSAFGSATSAAGGAVQTANAGNVVNMGNGLGAAGALAAILALV
ncbi:MAG: hypothetical protein M1823_003471 [Watsoniomyces obsoletus]|nr:MAG: hypothetical protein M1823_003471 [Watsoniomyces obsoletus]